MASEVDESLRQGVEHLKTIFDLCDRDKDGCISAEGFRTIGLEHFGETQEEVELLIREMDPSNSQHISFDMFLKGIEAYIVEHHQLPGSGSMCSLSSCTDDNSSTTEMSSTGGCESTSEDIYPLDHRFAAYLSNGYDSSASKGQQREVELIVEPCEETDSNVGRGPLTHSTPSPNGYSESSSSVSRESPTLTARNLLRKHQLMVESPSQGSTPGELADLEVSKLSDQLSELTSKLEDLQEDHRDSEGYRNKLRKENEDLKLRLEEYESELRDKEDNTRRILNESQIMLKSSLTKERRESEQQLQDIRSELEVVGGELEKTKDRECSLQSQLSMIREELSSCETELSESEEAKRAVEEELRKTKELLRIERKRWSEQSDSLKQELQDREVQVHQLQCDCEEAQRDRDRQTISAADIGREIELLKKELEQAHLKNEEMQVRFIQEGKELLQRNRDSLAAEMDNASKDEVLKALQDSEELNHRLQDYINKLLTNIIEKYPELLEIH